MRFWQALICAQMAAGSVYADRFHDDWWHRVALDSGNVILGAIGWLIFKHVWTPSPSTKAEPQ